MTDKYDISDITIDDEYHNFNGTQNNESVDVCELCRREGVKLTRHHLIPRSRHNKKRTKRTFSKAEMIEEIAMLCRPCHSQIHRLFDNHELASYYHTIERLKRHSEVAKFVNWMQNRPPDLKVRVRP